MLDAHQYGSRPDLPAHKRAAIEILRRAADRMEAGRGVGDTMMELEPIVTALSRRV